MLPAENRRADTSGAFEPGERILYARGDLLITTRRLRAKSRSCSLGEVRKVAVEVTAPSVRRPLLALGVGAAIGVPLATKTSVASPMLLLAVAIILFASILRLLWAQTTYALVVHTPSGPWRVLEDADAALVRSLAIELDRRASQP